MAKRSRIPFILSMMGTVTAVGAAVYFRNQLQEQILEEEAGVKTRSNFFLEVPVLAPEHLRQIKHGEVALTFWVDERGEQNYTVGPVPDDKV